MKTLETLYQEVLASDELKKGLAEAAKAPEGLEAWICAQGCEATAEEIGAFLKEKQAKTGELTDDELESAAGGCNKNEALFSGMTLGIVCVGMFIESATHGDFGEGGKDGKLLCHKD